MKLNYGGSVFSLNAKSLVYIYTILGHVFNEKACPRHLKKRSSISESELGSESLSNWGQLGRLTPFEKLGTRHQREWFRHKLWYELARKPNREHISSSGLFVGLGDTSYLNSSRHFAILEKIISNLIFNLTQSWSLIGRKWGPLPTYLTRIGSL